MYCFSRSRYPSSWYILKLPIAALHSSSPHHHPLFLLQHLALESCPSPSPAFFSNSHYLCRVNHATTYHSSMTPRFSQPDFTARSLYPVSNPSLLPLPCNAAFKTQPPSSPTNTFIPVCFSPCHGTSHPQNLKLGPAPLQHTVVPHQLQLP